MKATLTFTLPDESEEFETACKASAYRSIIEDSLNKLRSDVKYNPSNLPEPVLDYAEKFREWIYEQIREEGVRI